MSRVVKVTLSNEYYEALQMVAKEDGYDNGTRIDVVPVIRTGIKKYLNRRGIKDEALEREVRR